MNAIDVACSVMIKQTLYLLRYSDYPTRYEVEYWNPGGDGYKGGWLLKKYLGAKDYIQFAEPDIVVFTWNLEKYAQDKYQELFQRDKEIG